MQYFISRCLSPTRELPVDVHRLVDDRRSFSPAPYLFLVEASPKPRASSVDNESSGSKTSGLPAAALALGPSDAWAGSI